MNHYVVKYDETFDELFNIAEQSFGNVVGLPPEEDDTLFIVSSIVLSACGEERRDVVAPRTSAAIRDEKGRIISVPGFVKIPKKTISQDTINNIKKFVDSNTSVGAYWDQWQGDGMTAEQLADLIDSQGEN